MIILRPIFAAVSSFLGTDRYPGLTDAMKRHTETALCWLLTPLAWLGVGLGAVWASYAECFAVVDGEGV